MKYPNDCTYPHTRLCVHNCKYECVKQSLQRSGWRKAQIDDAEEEALAKQKPKQNQNDNYCYGDERYYANE